MILKRWLTGIVLGIIVFLATWFGDPYFSVGLGIIAVIAAFEFFPLIGVSRKHPVTIMGTIGVVLFIINAYYITHDHNSDKYTAPLLTAVVIIPLIYLIIKSDIKNAITHWAWLLAGVLYVGWMLSTFIRLRGIEDCGRDWTLLAIIACVASDSFAFHIGIRWGKHRMPNKISPSKTWEGTAAGFVAAFAVTMLLASTLPQLGIPVWQSAILGVTIGIFAPLGDLAESLLKRGAGVKDAGKWLPGHGGILDRIDSILFTVVVVYYFVTWVV